MWCIELNSDSGGQWATAGISVIQSVSSVCYLCIKLEEKKGVFLPPGQNGKIRKTSRAHSCDYDRGTQACAALYTMLLGQGFTQWGATDAVGFGQV